MTYFTSWDEFAKAAERLHSANPEKCRLVRNILKKPSLSGLKNVIDYLNVRYLHKIEKRKKINFINNFYS